MYLKTLLLTSTIFLTTSSLLLANDDPTKLETGRTILNAIHSDEIKNIMQRLNMLIYEREYTELELQQLNKKQIEMLAKEAIALSKTAADLPNITSLSKLTDEEQLTFNAMANQLRDIATELRIESDANHETDAVYIKLQSTCNTCHQLFRDR
jgi:cytochrome c556